MRSGSTLLQHILNQHSDLRSFSDLSSYGILARLMLGMKIPYNFCLKPMDLLFLFKRIPFRQHFNKFVWIARDPRDSYLSTMESGYAYLFQGRGLKEHEIDIGHLQRWKRIYGHYFNNPQSWHLVRYEDLVTNPDGVIRRMLTYLGLPFQQLFPFRKFNLINGGDYKICRSSTISAKSLYRYQREMTPAQIEVFNKYLGREMEQLGYKRK